LPDESLVLAAQVVDQFSVPIQNMQRQLRLLVENNAKAHTQGAGLAKIHTEAYSKLLVSVRQTARTLQGEFAPIVEKLGFSASAAGVGFAGMTAGILGVIGAGAGLGMLFQGTAHNLRDMSRATGLTINDLRVFEALGPRIGISAETMGAGLQSLAGHMDTLRRRPVAEISKMAAAGIYPDIQRQVAAIANLSRPDQFERLMTIGRGIQGGASYKRRFWAFFGLPENMANYTDTEMKTFIAQIKGNLRPLTEAQIMAGFTADIAWKGLLERLRSLKDTIGATVVPALNRAYDAAADFIDEMRDAAERYGSVLKGYFDQANGYLEGLATQVKKSDLGKWLQDQADKIKGIDWSANADELGRTLGPSLRNNLADLKKDLTDFLNDPMVKDPFKGLTGKGSLFDSVKATLPDWKGPLDDLKQLIATGNKLITVIDDLAGKHQIDWTLIFDLTGFKSMGDKFEAALAPGGFLHKFREFFDAINAHALGHSGNGPGRSPSGPAPAPFVLPKLDQFPKSETAPTGPRMPRLPISPIAFNPAGAAGASSKSDMINILAAGVRKGVYDGLYDFWQAMKGLNGKGGGAGGMITPASYETGSGGGGGGPGGGPGGSGAGKGGGGAGGVPGSTGGRFMDALARIESGNKNIYSQTDRDVAGPNSRSQGYFQINTPTWRDFAARAGVDLSKYPNAMSAPRDVQERVASVIPLSRFGPLTRRKLGQEFGPLDTHKPVGQLGPRDAPAAATPPGGTLTNDYAGLRLKSQEAVAGGSVERGLADLARHEEEAEGKNFNVFSALRDKFHVFENPKSAHNQGLAFDATTNDRDYEGARQRMRAYMNGLGFKEGALSGGSGDYAIEPGTRDHMHVQFNSREASERYHAMTHVKDAVAALHGQALRDHFGHRGAQRKDGLGQEVRREPGSLLRASNQMQAAASATHKVSGEASLRIKLASGLVPDGGVKNKGSLFKEIRLDRAAPPLASTTG
jgi:hypothetical protein